jgi:integrase/recombinase XerC
VHENYLTYLSAVRHLSENTLQAYGRDLQLFAGFLRERGLGEQDVDESVARSFVGELARGRLKPRSVNRVLSALRGYYRFLLKFDRLGRGPGQAGANPFRTIRSLKTPKPLPTFLFEAEVGQLLGDAPSASADIWQLRDLLIPELLYGTGCRVAELTAMNLMDLDLKERSVRVLGKGAKERIVFFGQTAAGLLRAYLIRKAHHKFPGTADERALLLNRRGGRITVRGVQQILERLLRSSGVARPASPHTFRHSFATHILNRGADIRVVQELLGHASLSTTQVYTHLDIERLKKVYEGAHPHARTRPASTASTASTARTRKAQGGS